MGVSPLAALVLAGGGGLSGPSGAPPPASGLPIYYDGGTLTCAPASASSGGCLTGGTQEIGGFKIFKFVIAGTYNHPVDPAAGLYDSAQFDYGVALGAPLHPLLDNSQVTIEGTKQVTDEGTGVVIASSHYRDAGFYFAINAGYPVNSPFFSVSSNGDVNFGPPRLSSGSADNSQTAGVLTDNSGVSGHIALQPSPKNYLASRGRLGENHDAVEPGGGRPWADGGQWVRTESDGGTYYAYAGYHGDHVFTSSTARYGGLLAEFKNPQAGAATDTKAFITPYGGFGQGHALTRAGFPPCPGTAIITSLGQFFYGAYESEQLYAFDEHRWHYCDGTQWVHSDDRSAD